MLILTVKLVFILATGFFVWGYTQRRRNNPLHRRLMLLGFLSTLSIAAVLVVGVYGLGLGYAPAEWLVRAAEGLAGARVVILLHRGIATVTLVLLIAQIATGVRRHPAHRKLARLVRPFWAVTYVSGLIVFA